MNTPASNWNAALTWADGTLTTLQMNGTIEDARLAVHTATTSSEHRQGRRPLLAVIGEASTKPAAEPAEIIHYAADGRIRVIDEAELADQPPAGSVHVVIGATEPSGETLDWLDDTACRSFAQGARRHAFIANKVRPHDDAPRYYFVRKLRLPEGDAGNGEPVRSQKREGGS